MTRTSPHFFPFPLPFVLAFFLLLAVVIALLEIGVLEYAYEKMGVNRRWISILLVLSLLGSYVNIPIAELGGGQIVSGRVVTFFGMRHVVPAVHAWRNTILAVNLGGAVIPVLLSLYLVAKNVMYGPALVSVAIVTVVVHRLAQPVPGVGIAVPMLVPPAVAASVAMLLSSGSRPALAYVCGTLGTLVGGDLLNLAKLYGLGAPVASIGGAGTFDGVFLTGIVAVLLA